MTLSAAYRLGQVPALLSDTLVSGGLRESHHLIVTRVDLEEPLPLEWVNPVSGLTRKSIVLAPNIAVAVVGNGLGAAVIVTKLRDAFQGLEQTAVELAKALAECDDALSEATCCEFVGWVIETSAPRSFKWNSRAPHHVDWDGDFIAGTGAGLFRNLAWNTHQREMKIEGFDHAQHYALTQVSALLLNEITNGMPIQNLFGGGYDLFL